MRRFVTLLAAAVALAAVAGCGTDRAGTRSTAAPGEAVTQVPLPDGLHRELAGQARAHPLPDDGPLAGQDFAAAVRDTPAGVGFALRSLPPCTASVPMSLDDESVQVAHNVTLHDGRYLVARQVSVFRDEYAEQFAEAFARAQPARCPVPGFKAPVDIEYTGFGKSETFPYAVLAEKHRAWASGEVLANDAAAATWVDLVVRRGSTVALVRVADLPQTVVTAADHDRSVAAQTLRARADDEMAGLLELLSKQQ